MIDIELSEQLPSSPFPTLKEKELPCLFFGFNIRNEYDNQRLKINEKYNPSRICYILPDFNAFLLYGIKLTPNKHVKTIFNIVEQRKKTLTLTAYENILNEFNLTCKETHGWFKPEWRIYPIDFENLKLVCDDHFNTDKKIFQHMLDIDEKVFEFQKFSSLRLFLIIE